MLIWLKEKYGSAMGRRCARNIDKGKIVLGSSVSRVHRILISSSHRILRSLSPLLEGCKREFKVQQRRVHGSAMRHDTYPKCVH